jgi:hypothetical protein
MSERSIAAEKGWRTRRRKQRKLSRAAKTAWKTRLANWKLLRKSIQLIECIPEDKIECSEAKMLKELFRIIDLQMSDNKETVDFVPAKARSPDELLGILRKTEQSCIHISCHGQYFKNYKKTGFKLPEGRLFSDKIFSARDSELPMWSERLDDKTALIPQLVFLSACETAQALDMVERFMQAGVRYVVAPREETPFSDAALFSSIFYTLVYVEQKNPYLAFKKVKETFPRMGGNWKFFDFYKHDFKVYDPNGTDKL